MTVCGSCIFKAYFSLKRKTFGSTLSPSSDLNKTLFVLINLSKIGKLYERDQGQPIINTWTITADMPYNKILKTFGMGLRS